MDVTVAICTWNRARLLDATLAELCKMRVPDGLDWEVVVVDNNSTDTTPSVVESYVGRLPIRRVVEPVAGIANARNCALRSARADLLLFTDDDVLVDDEWLNAYVEAARRWPDAGYFGGIITPWYELEPPSWIRENAEDLGPIVGVRHLGATERVLGPDEPPFGANVAFRRKAFSTQRYDPRLGRTRDDQVNGEDTTYARGLAAAGFQGVYVPSAKIKHYFVASRMTLAYVRAYSVGAGRTEVRLVDPGADRVPRWVYRVLVESYVEYFCRRLIAKKGWMKSMIRASRARGAWLEYREQRRAIGKGPSLGARVGD
jgi:glycosyltransferase involved in cell wall biosynthesis